MGLFAMHSCSCMDCVLVCRKRRKCSRINAMRKVSHAALVLNQAQTALQLLSGEKSQGSDVYKENMAHGCASQAFT